MVLHGIALYDLVSYIIYLACFCVFRFVARAVSRKTPILLIDFKKTDDFSQDNVLKIIHRWRGGRIQT